eukprot:scaffold5853_cov134-Pinguiococcus_pyrenoidosus.AAC.1
MDWSKYQSKRLRPLKSFRYFPVIRQGMTSALLTGQMCDLAELRVWTGRKEPSQQLKLLLLQDCFSMGRKTTPLGYTRILLLFFSFGSSRSSTLQAKGASEASNGTSWQGEHQVDQPRTAWTASMWETRPGPPRPFFSRATRRWKRPT